MKRRVSANHFRGLNVIQHKRTGLNLARGTSLTSKAKIPDKHLFVHLQIPGRRTRPRAISSVNLAETTREPWCVHGVPFQGRLGCLFL